ncbi:transforming growth factor-beta receptor-associated protein 1-like isoform X2 [Chenopodium quinoa]|uniref:transforming growth factor-beta receptor-associated protein 1-like isoform X2 n=1 Tax=Chenopodium quinoa TaxID=63459 RepID=UPI000B786EFC|nr:transforming growth factor-beta receptor-associated protein 1-like isoform X2 [Chenopodium quinoa]
MLGRNNENGPLLPGSRASAPFALPQGRNLPSNCRTVLESLAHFDLSSTSSSSSSLHSFNCVAIAVIDDSQLVIYCGTNSGDLLLLTINPNCDRSLSATVDDADDGRLKVVRCVNISRSAVNSIHVVNQISRILVLSDGFLYLVDLQLLQPVKKLGILKGVNIVARRVCSTESGNSNWILEDGVSSSGSTVGGRLMKKLGGGVRSNRARVKEFSSRGVDNDGACLFVVAMGKKVLFIELNSGSSKHDREVDGQRGLFVILKEMPCIDGVKTMAWLDDSLILGTDSAYSLMSCITGHVNLIFSLPDTAAIPCLKLLSKDKKVLLLVDNAGIIVDRHGQPVGGTLVFGCAPCSIAELSSYVVVACNGKMEIYHKISGNCVQALSFKGNVGTSNCFVADEEDVNGRFVVFATSSKVFCYRKIPSEEQIKDLLRKKNYKEAISLVEELEVDGDLSREMVSFVHAQVGFLLLFDLRFEEAIEHFLLSETMEPSEIFPFVIRDPNRWSLLVPRNRYWGLHPPPVHVEDVVEDGLLAIQRAAFLKKAGVESAVDNEFLLNPPTRADLLDSAFRNLIRYLLVMRHKDLIQPVKEGVDTVLMYLYRILNCTEDMENLASSENSCVVEELESLLEESGHLRTLAFLYVNKGMSSNALAIWRVLARNYPLGTHQDVADSYNVSDSNSIPVSSRETASIEASKILEESADVESILQHLGWISEVNEELAVRALTSQKRTSQLPPDDVIAAIDPRKIEILQRYLQWLIEDQDSSDTHFHTLYALSLAKTAFESLETNATLNATNKSMREPNTCIPGRNLSSENPVRERLQIFLHSSDLYDAEEVLELIEGSDLWLEKAILYRKLGQETLVLQILALKLEDSEAAEQYCVELGRPDAYMQLLDMYLDPQNGKEPMFNAAVRLLHNHGESLDPLQVLERLSPDMPLQLASETILRMLRARLHHYHQGKIVHSLSRAVDVDARLARLEERARNVQLNDESLCDSCHARLGTKLFAMYPDDSIVCYKCFRRLGESTSVGRRNFKKDALIKPGWLVSR